MPSYEYLLYYITVEILTSIECGDNELCFDKKIIKYLLQSLKKHTNSKNLVEDI